ncbi:MAG: polyisoprenoid-binding protein [Deltaproteobacteria bacterium]|nr:polyisoprenoid-binding protein [Deltaproteobacteria bacterium]
MNRRRNTLQTLSGLAALGLAFGTPVAALASPYTLDPAHSVVGFRVKHMVVTDVRGQFHGHSGTIDINDEDLRKSSVDIVIDAASIDTGIEKRDTHLKSPDFFDTAAFPKLSFKSTKVEPAGKGRLKVTGDLTMRGVTKPVVLDVEGPTGAIKNPWGVPVRSISASTKLSRKDWGLTWNKPIETGGLLVGDEVVIEISAELNPRQ